MPNHSSEPAPALLRRRGRRYRTAAAVILLLGLACAGLVYGLGSRAPDYSTDPAMVGFSRSEDRQMGVLYGKQGRLIEDLNHALAQPGNQAILILIATGVVTGGLFHIARVLEERASQP